MTNKRVRQHIFKVQLPLDTNIEPPELLIYNKDRSVMDQLPITPEISRLFPKGVFKIYVKGSIDRKGIVDIQQVVEDQSW